MEYPKWVQRSQDLGPVLCVSAQEEAKVLADHAAYLKHKAEVDQPEVVPVFVKPQPKAKKS